MLRNPPDYPLALLVACYEKLFVALDQRPESDRSWQLLADLDLTRALEMQAQEAA